MNRTVEQLTEHLLSQLPEKSEFYTLENLTLYGFPSFLVDRIAAELRQRVARKVNFPETRWVHTQAEEVQQTWQLFLESACEQVQLPVGSAQEIIGNAAEDVVNILVQPRKNIPDLLMAGRDSINADKLRERVNFITVYKHFKRVLTGYVERKNRTELSKEQCKTIITNIDKKLTDGYSPLQWAQLLDPLFELAGNQIDADLIRLFFEDKKKVRTAREFELTDGPVSRERFIEILSSPVLLDLDGYESDQSELFNTSSSQKDSNRFIPPSPVADVEEEKQQNSSENNETSIKKGQDVPENPLTKSDEKKAFETTTNEQKETVTDKAGDTDETGKSHDTRTDDKEKSKASDEMDVVNNTFSAPKKTRTENRSLNEIFAAGNEKDEQSAPENVSAEHSDTEISAKKQNPEENTSAVDPETAVPIWKRFVDSEDSPQEQKIPSFGQSRSTEETEPLRQKLYDRKSYFVDVLFDGSESSYEESISKIAKRDSWESASKLIEKDIFKKHSVDIYSREAVDFTNRLQNYFSEKRTTNK